MMLRYSDGCAAQYKSKGPLAGISYSSSDYGFPMIHNFFGSRHGKGPSDGESAVIKSHVSTAAKNETVIIGNARELYEYCVDALEKDASDTACTHFRRSFYYIANVERERTKIKTVAGTRSIHCVSTADSNRNCLKTRKLSCFCQPCVMGNGKCENTEYVDDWKLQNLKQNIKKSGNWTSNCNKCYIIYRITPI